jgi:hypothetical protein
MASLAPGIFRAYDVRGVVGTDCTADLTSAYKATIHARIQRIDAELGVAAGS